MFSFLYKLLEINGPRESAKRLAIELAVYRRYLTPRKALNLWLSLWRMNSHCELAGVYPYRYYIEPTNACNLKCPYCFGWQGRSKRRVGSMALATFRRIIDDVEGYACWIDLYNRGEPLANPDIYDMIAYAHAKGIGTKISSNFHLIDEEKAEMLVSSGLDHLVIPLDGASQNSYEKYRVGGDLKLVIENIKHLVRWKHKLRSKLPYITLRVLLMRQNEHEIPDLRRLAQGLGVDNLFFFPMFINATDPKAVEAFLPQNEMYSWYDRSQGVNRLAKRKSLRCPELWQRGTINWDGAVFPCCYVDEGIAYGNVQQDSLRFIWNSQPFIDSRRALLGKVPASRTLCTQCRGRLKQG